MHELSMCEAIARTVTERAAGRRVRKVCVQIGHLRQVVPDAMAFSWQMLTSTTELDGAELEIDHVPATVVCNRCGARTTPAAPFVACQECTDSDVSIVTGDELTLVSIELDEVTSAHG